ncbi:cGMP-dependent protein kinase, isozyme 1-like isoform X2 [Periplaneta americana]|uniref:cGMP-dependent protein kinase, isozyme 1-like isoform X2 n=2 Tax=Periplaneta americana TaxID=6978 RepID=UPI0037E81227
MRSSSPAQRSEGKMKFLSFGIFSSKGKFKPCTPVREAPGRESYQSTEHVRSFGRSTSEVSLAVSRQSVVAPAPRRSEIDSIAPQPPRDSHEALLNSQPNKRKEEVSAEVPKLGISAESHTASDIRTPVFDKNQESQELIKNAIMGNDFLKNLDQGQVQALVEAMYMKEYAANQHVITEGETGSHLYVSADGEFEVFVGEKKVSSFGPGRAFGELAILYNTKRNATIRVVTNARVWVLNRQVFQQIMMRTRLKDIEDKVKFLRSHPLLKDLSTEILAKMSDLLKVEFFPPGHCIIKQGDKGDKFYIISGGNVKITKLQPGEEKEQDLGTLSHGKYFGELALLKEDTRQATVTAMTPGVECLVLDRVHFIQLLGDLEQIKNNVDMYSNTKRESWERTKQNTNLEYGYIELHEMDIVGTLGVGGFGRVELVQYRKDKNLTFALKCLKKCYVVEQQQEEHAYNEKGVMLACSDSPFISKLYRTYRDNKYVYFLMEACLGGDVFTVLQKYRFFDENTARFMTGCVVEALHYLHDRGFIYRDLKPENLLLDHKGYVKMIDFGFAKRVGHSGKTWTFAGTPEYVAPEIILNKGHDRAVDYWALGVFIHELITGRPPFRGKDHMQTYNLILKGIESVHFPKHVTKGAQNLVRRLCRAVATERLGYQKAGVQDIKNHKWFQGFNWEALRNRKILAPIIRPIPSPTYLGNFDKYPKDKSVPPDETSGWDKDF